MAYRPISSYGSVVVVHRDHVGFVLGRQHSTVNGVARNTNTRIQVKDTDKDSIMVGLLIGGRSVEDVRGGYEGLMNLARLAEEKTARVGHLPRINEFHTYGVMAQEYRVHLEPEDVGMVLGSKGATLRKVAYDTWTWIKFLKGTETTRPVCSVRGFLKRDVDEAVKRICGIAQESLNRRTGGGRHHTRAMTVADMAGEFKIAPVPQSKRVSFKVKTKAAGAGAPAPRWPVYAPESADTKKINVSEPFSWADVAEPFSWADVAFDDDTWS